MEFINIPTALFSSPEYIGAEPVQRATWISLLAWCCEQENGGVIEGCRSWGMRRWMQTCGVTDQEINVENELYHFDGDHLIVFGYPHEIQETLKVKRNTARENGKLGGRPKKTNVETNIGTNTETEEKPTSVFLETNIGTEIGTNVAPYIETYPKTVREGKGRKEGNNEGEKTTTVDNTPWGEPPAAPVLPPSPFPDRERLNDVRGMHCADNHADLGASPGATRFIAATLEINPSWGRTIPTAIETAAALEAYRSAQGRVTPRDMEMLKAYYASGLTEDRNKKAFWRPDSRRKFWECFGDVLTHADRWAKETRWKSAAARKKPQPEQAPQQPEGPVVDTDTAAAEIRGLMKEIGLGGEA